ncbi:MAG: helix-turn-helix transcriptional regulator [Deltaproteobacteria bacterium]|nr:helix-turn-helix transcriptional regulator [Deltaproteobacteria bacterium]
MAFPAAALAGYTLWLLSLPMEGFLLGCAGGATSLLFFLFPHVASLFLSSRLPRQAFAGISRLAGLTAVAGTLLFPLWPECSKALLVALGVLSGPVALRAGAIVKADRDPQYCAASSLIAANLLLAALVPAPVPFWHKLVLVGLALSVPVLTELPGQPIAALPGASPPPRREPLSSYLPLIFVFHLVSGIFYGSLMPAYERVRLLPAVELVFYVAAVLLALKPFAREMERALTGAVLLSMSSLGLFLAQTVESIHLSMFAMQAAAGFMDVFVLFLLLGQDDPIDAFGVGLGTLCSGILAGNLVSLFLGNLPGAIPLIGNMALNLALLALYWLGRRTPAQAPVPLPVEPEERPAAAHRLPPGLHARLSAMERSVLSAILNGSTFREAAAELAVSESSIKTYMRRIYEKAGVRGKDALLALLSPEGEA